MDNNIIELFTKFIENKQTAEENLQVIAFLELGENMEEWKVVVDKMHDVHVSKGILTKEITQKTFKKISARIKHRKIKNIP